MSNVEIEKIMEKRSSMRSWRSRGGKIPKRDELIGAALIFLMLFGIIAYSLWVENNSTPSGHKKITPIKTQNKTPTFPNIIPAPVIKINSPKNITYETSTPYMNFTVAGSNLKSVIISVDGGKDVSIPHNGTIAKINNTYKPLQDGLHKLKIFANNTQGKTSSKTVEFKVISKNETKIYNKIGIPVVNNGFEIILKSVTPSSLFISVWILVNNTEVIVKPFKIGPGTAILDDMNQQYAVIKVARSTEISQTNLYPQATREGMIFFEPLKEGRSPKKIVLYINGNQIEFLISEL